MTLHLTAPTVSRRQMLKTAAGGFGYLALAGLASEAAAAAGPLEPREPHFTPRAKRVIFLFMQGGPSHLDTFDHKPKLNADQGQAFPGQAGSKLLGSPWKFARHGQSGQSISELFPHLARHADDLCVVNSLHTETQAHPTAVPMMHTGSAQQVRPSLGAWVLYGLGSESSDLPGFIAMNPLNKFGQNHGSAFMPASYQATLVQAAVREGQAALPNLQSSHLTRQQQREQLKLLRKINERRLAQDEVNGELEAVIHSYEMAFRMQSAVPSLMDFSSESAATLKLYGLGEKGTDGFARQCLLARRFAEAGVRFIEIGTGGWDHHKDLATDLPASTRSIDQPIAGLLADLKQRGMLQDTLLVWGGEFGRTPYAHFDNGRDHNNRGFTMWLAGGGIRGGLRYGLTDEYGADAIENRVHVHDLHATILHCLGLDHEKLTYRYSGRDFRLTDVKGNVVKDILT